MNMPPIVSSQEWEAARETFGEGEGAYRQARSPLNVRMPRMAVEKEYEFEGPKGPPSLADLFEGRRQLIVYRAFYAPDITTFAEGAPTRSEHCGLFLGRRPGRTPRHMNARDTTLAFVSRAPQADIQGLKERMGGTSLGTPSPTISTPTSASTSGTGPTPSSGRATASSAPTSSTTAATRRWGAPGATSTSPRLGGRRSGRTHPTAIRKRRPTGGGTTTTRTRPLRLRP